MPIGPDPRGASGFLGQFTDPLSPTEWWTAHIGVTDWVAPGPGVPVTMIDSGVDLSHEEFAGRPDTIPLNTQTTTANDEELHGTATASVVGAPVNAKGIVGIYPQAKLQLWDASPTGQLTVGDEIAGLTAARRHGPGVINLSLGGFDRLPIEEHAILNAFGAGQLIVASAGNDREQGSSLVVPRELRARAHGRRHGRVRPRDRRSPAPRRRWTWRRPGRTSRPPSRRSSIRAATPRSTARASPPRSSPVPPPRSGRCGRR